MAGLAGMLAPILQAHAQADAPITEIVVTAQKREQAVNTVGMSITAASGDQLQARGIYSVEDLTRLVPGFTVQHSNFNSTSFTLRGVGFFNSDLATPAAVTVYVDEAPLPFPALSKLAAFDLERVEILKGPQGTLFGENATGGAVNYIAAKPTKTFSEGMDASYGNFNRYRLGGFLSGPINDQLSFRVAFEDYQGDPWQQSVSRPGDGLGRIDELQGRATLDWRPNDIWDSRLTFTATHNGSDSEAGQFLSPLITIPALAAPGLANFPAVPKPRAADWATVIQGTNTPFPYASDTNLYQVSWRNDVQLGDDITVTSLTSTNQYSMNYGEDPSGTPFNLANIIDRGARVASYFQELRGTGRIGDLVWLVGANVEQETTHDNPVSYTADNSASHALQAVDPAAIADSTQYTSRLRANTYAIFGRLQYDLSDQVSLEGALRYNMDYRTFDNCAIATTDAFVTFWNLFRGERPPPTKLGECYVINTATGLPVGNVQSRLDQNSVPWRVGLNWTAQPGLLIYANISQGYKAGAAPVLAAATVSQFTPVPQESLLAYETGIKAALLDRSLQVNAAAFYYDYRDKQLRGAELDPNFGPLSALVSIPQSHVAGIEAQVVAKPIQGLTIDASGTYLYTNIDQFTGFNALANLGNYSGTPFPFSPKWQVVADVNYEMPLTSDMTGFVGASLTYNSKTYAGIGALSLTEIDAYSLLDLRAGVTLDGEKYRAWLWGKNVTNTYYWNDVFIGGDAASRFVGQPATYGITISARL
jgi:iron complex outermembrane receptor protein